MMPGAGTEIPYGEFTEAFREKLRGMGLEGSTATLKDTAPSEKISQPDSYVIKFSVPGVGVPEPVVTTLNVSPWDIEPDFRVNSLGGWLMGDWIRGHHHLWDEAAPVQAPSPT